MMSVHYFFYPLSFSFSTYAFKVGLNYHSVLKFSKNSVKLSVG
jgi:hypothetical protein